MANVLTLEKIKDLANAVTDETFAITLIRGYADEAIAHINITLGSTLPPFAASTTEVYIALDDMWLRTIVVNFIADRIKRNDGSLNEANMYEQTWRLNLNTLKKEKRNYIADEYKGTNFSTTYANDPSKGLNLGWWHR
jgi:hypothetical protein